ncbi:hypothetical protein L6452_16100 [Arctium lappa]|uniref:Uncharacterized protein n=1 Tax=Arctium lappa TaxID=4217 RepID=A0ACB9BZN4_ARCLA|nr:hypothetical protein L6452_16100 [Arctium lappa]
MQATPIRPFGFNFRRGFDAKNGVRTLLLRLISATAAVYQHFPSLCKTQFNQYRAIGVDLTQLALPLRCSGHALIVCFIAAHFNLPRILSINVFLLSNSNVVRLSVDKLEQNLGHVRVDTAVLWFMVRITMLIVIDMIFLMLKVDYDFQCYSRLAVELKIVRRVSTDFGLLEKKLAQGIARPKCSYQYDTSYQA